MNSKPSPPKTCWHALHIFIHCRFISLSLLFLPVLTLHSHINISDGLTTFSCCSAALGILLHASGRILLWTCYSSSYTQLIGFLIPEFFPPFLTIPFSFTFLHTKYIATSISIYFLSVFLFDLMQFPNLIQLTSFPCLNLGANSSVYAVKVLFIYPPQLLEFKEWSFVTDYCPLHKSMYLLWWLLKSRFPSQSCLGDSAQQLKCMKRGMT